MKDLQHDSKAVVSQTGTAEGKGGKYLTFRLAEEEYGLEILKVREIIGLMEITKVPRTPHYIRGVINLRGKVIPVLDLRSKFGMDGREDTEETCIIVVEVVVNDIAVMTGLVVDAVSEVLDIDGGQIEDSPEFGAGVDTDFILGIGKIREQVKILLDIDKVLGDANLSMLSGMQHSESREMEETNV